MRRLRKRRLVWFTADVTSPDHSRLCLICNRGGTVDPTTRVCGTCGFSFTEDEDFKRYTAETNVYGEPTEDGHGQVLTSGWISPDWSTSTVYENRDDVAPDEMDADEERSRVQWLADTLASRLGAIDDWDGGSSVYAADTVDDWHTITESRLAAHPKGFTNAEVAEAVRLAKGER